MKYIRTEFYAGRRFKDDAYIVEDNATDEDIAFDERICNDFDDFVKHSIPSFEGQYDEDAWYDTVYWEWYEIEEAEYNELYARD